MRPPGRTIQAGTGAARVDMHYLVFGIILVPCALLVLFVLALATGAIHETDELHQVASNWKHSWKSLVQR